MMIGPKRPMTAAATDQKAPMVPAICLYIFNINEPPSAQVTGRNSLLEWGGAVQWQEHVDSSQAALRVGVRNSVEPKESNS
jgi:hypothetical protein